LESHQAASPVSTTVTATTQQQPTTSVPLAKQSILSTPAESPDSTPIPSLLENIHDASYVNSSLLKPINNSDQNQKFLYWYKTARLSYSP